LVEDDAAPPAALADLFAGKSSADGEPRLYVCENFTCQAPAAGRPAIVAEIARLAPSTAAP
ncbi:MAG: hypothetical protein AAF961_03505, partial [Planctomycetota bacterium]